MLRIVSVCSLVFLFAACGEGVDPVNCEKSGPVLSLGTVENASSCSVENGSLKVTATLGKEPYEFSINDQPGQTSGVFNNLAAGVYSARVKDGNGCSTSIDNISINASDFVFSTTIISNTSCLTNSGEVVVDVAQDNPPYTFKLGNGSFSENNTFTGLSTGSHFIAVKDNSGCSITLSVTVPRGFTGTSWLTDILPIMETSCALSGCHNGTSRPDLRLYANAKFYAASMKSKTKDKSMPREGTLSQQQISIIACWVDDGALEN